MTNQPCCSKCYWSDKRTPMSEGCLNMNCPCHTEQVWECCEKKCCGKCVRFGRNVRGDLALADCIAKDCPCHQQEEAREWEEELKEIIGGVRRGEYDLDSRIYVFIRYFLTTAREEALAKGHRENKTWRDAHAQFVADVLDGVKVEEAYRNLTRRLK